MKQKYADENISRHLAYYTERLKPAKASQIVAKLRRHYDQGKIKVIDPITYFGKPL